MTTDIRPWMAGLSHLIEGSAYHLGGEDMGFAFDGLPVLLEPRRMTVFGAQDEAQARRAVDWLTEMVRRVPRPDKG